MADDLISMELDDEDKLDAPMPIAMPSKPDFPYGLKFCLTHKEFAKMPDIDPADAHVGARVEGRFSARITSVSADDNEHVGESCRIEFQIEALRLLDEDGDNDDK